MDYDILDLENIALDIRKYFKQYKSQQNGRPYRPHKDHDTHAVWLNAAEKCSELKCDPLTFVEIAFQNAKHGPFPKHLGSKAMDRWAQNHSQLHCKEIADGDCTLHDVDLREEIRTAEHFCWSAVAHRDKKFEDVIKSEVFPISAYVRIYLSPDVETVKLFAERASEEIQNNPGLYAALHKLNMDMSLIFK